MGVEAETDHGERCDQLHRRLKRIVKARGSLDLQEAAALREAQQIKIWRRYGYSSLVEYMELEMGYSPRAGLERLRVANALPELPQIAAAIEQGDLSFSGARELTRVATPETEQKWLGATTEMNLREVEAAVSGHTRGDLPTDPPDPKLQRTILRLEIRPETLIRYREAKRKLEKLRGERTDDDAVVEEMCRVYMRAVDRDDRLDASGAAGSPMNRDVKDVFTAAPSGAANTNADAAAAARSGAAHTNADAALTASGSVVGHASPSAATPADAANTNSKAGAASPSGAAARAVVHKDPPPYRWSVTTCKECKRGWLHGAGTVSLMTPAAVERAQCDAQMIGDLDSPEIERAKQTIPASIRQKVKARDEGRCRVPGCRSSVNLDIHHIMHLMYGGTNHMTNLITLCEAHHLELHEGTLSITISPSGEVVIKREGRNNFTRVTRAIDAAKVLTTEGYAREVVRAAIDRTKTHVGKSDLTVQQWLEIARRYLRDVEQKRTGSARE